MSSPIPPEKSAIEKANFLREITSSQFNLITDVSTRTKIISMIGEVPENTLFEKILKSQLYLIIGNVTKSDNILKEIVNVPPIENWKGFTSRPSIFHKEARANLRLIFDRLGRHPADRKVFHLLGLYLQNYFNDPELVELLSELEPESLKHRMALQYTERLSPKFVRFLRLKRLGPAEQSLKLRSTKEFPIKTQMYWVWPFLDVEPQVSENLVSELSKLYESNPIWFHYLMEDEKLADLYISKSRKSFLPGRRHFFLEKLKEEPEFMLALYKLIEIGAIDGDLVKKTVHFLRHE